MKILNKSLINKEIYYYVPLENIRKFDENLQKDILYVLHFMGVKKLWFKMETEDEPISFAYEIIDFFEKKGFDIPKREFFVAIPAQDNEFSIHKHHQDKGFAVITITKLSIV